MKFLSFTFFMSIVVSELARRWITSGAAANINLTRHVAVQLFYVVATMAFWAFGMMRFFKGVEWSRLLALASVLLVFCPAAWLFAHRLEAGGDFVALFLLQSPLVIAYTFRKRGRVPHA
jgi:hypothetical protein